MMRFKVLGLLCLFVLVVPIMAQDANLTDTCVSDYAVDVDYFPDKVDIEYAENFTVTYHNHYKVVSVSDAFDGAPDYQYVLFQCGTPVPSVEDFPEGTQVVEVPTGEFITLSTTQLPTLTQLDLLDNLVGVDSLFYVSNEDVLRLAETQDIAELGFGADINIEMVLELEPDMVLTYGLDPSTDAFPMLIDAGIFTVLDASWRELSPLGRAEWVKFTAVFYNVEVTANSVYDDIVTQYEDTRALVSELADDDRPQILLNTFLNYADAWFIPGADTYVGQLVHDAGGDIILSEPDSTASNPMSFETVYDAGLDADIWLLETFAVNTVDDLLALDDRFGDFEALQSGNTWNNNRDENANGGNNYYELGVMNPHLVLMDLVAIFHPELLPDHRFNFYKPLESS